jgi:hypothetical protein
MASGKKKRKHTSIIRKQNLAPSSTPPLHRDGDRRRRLGPLVRQALDLKRKVHEWTIDSGPEPPPIEPAAS